MRTKILLAAIIAIFCIIPASAQTAIQLNLKKGETYHQTTTTTAEVIQSVSGMNITITTTVDSKYAYKVTETTGDNYDIEVTYEKLIVNMSLPQMNMSYSSENPKDAISTFFASLDKQPFNIKMSKYGEVLEVSNLDKLTNAAGLSETDKAIVTQVFGEEQIKSGLESLSTLYTKTTVSKGNSWEDKTTMSTSGMEFVIASKYTLVETGSTNKISGTITINTDPNAAPMVSQGMSMKLNLSGTGTADVTLDAKTGWITDATIKQNIKGEAQILDGMAAGMTIPITMNNATIYK